VAIVTHSGMQLLFNRACIRFCMVTSRNVIGTTGIELERPVVWCCMCLLHEATPTSYALMHEAYTVQMHIPSCCNNLCSQGCSSLNINVGSEVNNLQIERGPILCAYIFSITVCLP